ncbi:retrovirus-related pol polyprotein from transposon TNT 1-94 [Tanacetum coccineum]
MPTEMELTLEQTQQGVSYEVSNIRVNSFTMKMEILLVSTSNKLMVGNLKMVVKITCILHSSHDDGSKPLSDDGKKVEEDPRKESECKDQEKEDNVYSTNNVNTVSSTINAAGTNKVNAVGGKTSIKLPFDLNMHVLEDDSIFNFSRDDEDDGVVADINNLDTTIKVSHILTTRIHKDHLLDQEESKKALNGFSRIKKDERGIVIRNKARLVAQGYTQEEGIDYDECLLYGKIQEEVYVCQPPGFKDPDFLDRVYKVEKALYGLHQAPRAWYETLSTYLLDNGFQRGKIDKTLFIKRHKGDILLVQVYMDDIIFGSINKELCNAFEKLIHEKFLLGITKVKIASTPMETQKPLPKDEDGEEVDVYMYRSIIGSLIYLTSSRPDIMFTVCACDRYQVNPKVSHLYAVKRIFRYLKGQLKLGLWYPKDSPFDLVAYTDSDYVGASLDKKSKIGAKKSVRLMMGMLFGMELELMLAKTINGEVQLHALVDGKKIVIAESSVRRDLQLADEEGVPQPSDPIENVEDEAVYKELGDILVRATTIASSLEVEQDSGNINKTQSKATPNESSSQGTNSGGGPWCQETIGDTIAQTRLKSVSKHSNDSLLKRGNTLQSDQDRLKIDELMALCTTLQNWVLDLEKTKTTQHNEIASLKRRVKKLEKKNRSRTHRLKRLYKFGLTAKVEFFNNEESLGEDASKQGRIDAIDADEEITQVSVHDVNVSAGEEVFATTVDDITLDQVLEEMKSIKPKKKGIVIQELADLMKKKGHVREKSKKEEEANIALIETWDDIQAKIDADHQLAERMHAQEKKDLSIKEKATLFQQLLKKRRKHFAAKRAEEKRNKHNKSANREDNVYLPKEHVRIQAQRFEVERITKKQKVEDNKATTKLKQLMKIIPDEEEVALDAIPLAVKSPMIIDWKIYKEGRKSYYQIMRADGKSQIYMFFSQMLKSFDREDLEDLYKLVKAKYESTRPVEDLDLLLWGDLKTMFEPHVEDKVWRNQQEYKVLNWKLFESFGVHSLMMQHVQIYMLVENKYPLAPLTLSMMLEKKLMIDYETGFSAAHEIQRKYSKDEAPEEIKTFLKKITVLLQALVIIVRTDNSTEFKNQVLQEYFNSVGISHQASSVRTPQQNEVVITKKLMLVGGARNTVDFFSCTKPDISFLHVLWALYAILRMIVKILGKLGVKGGISFFIGYSANSCAYRVYNRRTKKIIETMNVTFVELSVMAFKQTMYDDHIGGQPPATPRTISAAQAPQVLQTSTATTTIADTAPTPTNSSSQATSIPSTLQDVDELETQQQHVQHELVTIADNVLMLCSMKIRL